MASAAAVAQAGAVLPDQNFLGAVMLNDRGANNYAFNGWASNERIAVVRGNQQRFEIDAVSGFDRQLFNVNHFAWFGAILASASANNSIHGVKASPIFSFHRWQRLINTEVATGKIGYRCGGTL